MTTGPSSGHSESWYWLQSSHPANRHQTVRGHTQGGRHPKDIARLHAWETQTPHLTGETNRAPHKYKTEQTQDLPPQGKDPALRQFQSMQSHFYGDKE